MYTIVGINVFSVFWFGYENIISFLCCNVQLVVFNYGVGVLHSWWEKKVKTLVFLSVPTVYSKPYKNQGQITKKYLVILPQCYHVSLYTRTYTWQLVHTRRYARTTITYTHTHIHIFFCTKRNGRMQPHTSQLFRAFTFFSTAETAITLYSFYLQLQYFL